MVRLDVQRLVLKWATIPIDSDWNSGVYEKKESFGPEKFWVHKNFKSLRIFSLEKDWVSKKLNILGAEKFWVQKNFVSKSIKKFWVQKIHGSKDFLFQNEFGPGKILGLRNFLNIFGPKKFLVQKIVVPK